MTSETRPDGSSIPLAGISVKSAISGALAGCAVRVRPLGLDVSRDASVTDLVTICEKLFRAASKITLAYQFCLGDAHNHTLPYSSERRELTRQIDKLLGASYADRLRHFGSIARRWPEDRRSDKYCWQWYKDHKPGVPGKADVKVEKPLQEAVEVSREGCLLTLETPGGHRFLFRLGRKPSEATS